jgi:hypothetical protein
MGDSTKRGPIEARPTKRLARVELEALLDHAARARRPSDLEALIEVMNETSAVPHPKLAVGTARHAFTLRRTSPIGVSITPPAAPVETLEAPVVDELPPLRSSNLRDFGIGAVIGLVALAGVWLVVTLS